MQALATPLVTVLHPGGAYTFTRREGPGGRTTYGARRHTLDDVADLRPGSVFETGHRWQLVPAKLYRFEDRRVYLRERYPLVADQRIGALALPQLDAVAVYDRHPELPDSLHSGNHVAELVLDALRVLARAGDSVAVAFFIGPICWFALAREGEVVALDNFAVNADTDAVFYAAALLSHYGVPREECPLAVGGTIAADGQLHRQLSIYFDLHNLGALLTGAAQGAPQELLLAYGRSLRQQPLASD